MLDVLNVTQYLGVHSAEPEGQVRYSGLPGVGAGERGEAWSGRVGLPASTYAVVEVTGPISSPFRLVLPALRKRSSRRIRSTARWVVLRCTVAAICRRLITAWSCGFRWRSVPRAVCFCRYSCSFSC